MKRSPGIGLVELLVGLGLSILVILAGLEAYDRFRLAVEMRSSTVERQQALRSALANLLRELRLAGFNVDPDGDPARTDEAIELAHATAIVFRADLDRITERADAPEGLLGGGVVETITTGNDEIVGYVLARADGSSAGSFVFDADVEGVPRDGSVERIRIGSVALTHDAPPYTLYRLRLRHDSTIGLRAPVADDIRALRFVYLDRSGAVIPPPGGHDDAASRRARRSIHGIRVEIDSGGGASRRIVLGGFVVPRNLGLSGAVDAPG